jgi:hypothetical protein
MSIELWWNGTCHYVLSTVIRLFVNAYCMSHHNLSLFTDLKILDEDAKFHRYLLCDILQCFLTSFTSIDERHLIRYFVPKHMKHLLPVGSQKFSLYQKANAKSNTNFMLLRISLLVNFMLLHVKEILQKADSLPMSER